MARISRYPRDNDLKGSDKLIGTDEDGLATKTFTLTSIFDEMRVTPTPYVTMQSPSGADYILSVSDFGQLIVLPGVPNPPVITGLPVITGSAAVADTLTATAAPFAGVPAAYSSLQWQRLPASGVWENIDGATSATYTVVIEDLGARFRVRQTATNVVGTVSVNSLETAVVEGNPIQVIYIDPMKARMGITEGEACLLTALTALDNIEVV